jgi:hypothetical protein
LTTTHWFARRSSKVYFDAFLELFLEAAKGAAVHNYPRHQFTALLCVNEGVTLGQDGEAEVQFMIRLF